MNTQMFKWGRENLNTCECGQRKEVHVDKICPHGKFTMRKEDEKVQGVLRPIELWEYIFPRESLQEVLAMQNIHQNYNELRPEVNRLAWIFRKAMGAKPIPDMPDLKKKQYWEITQKFVPMDGMAVYPIGIREDAYQDYPQYGYKQEGL